MHARETEFVAEEGQGSLELRSVSIEITSGQSAGRVARIDRPSMTIGSGVEVDIRLDDPTVSRLHLSLRLTPEGLELRDERSTNGTWIGNIQVREVLLTRDTTVALGGAHILFRMDHGSLSLPISDREVFGGAIGHSPGMRHVFALLERAASTDIPLLIEGESGTGKGVLARAVHDASLRSRGPFVTVNCGAIPEKLIESELFGHEQGAFTGADAAKPGRFEEASGGTLFLDEIGELPLVLQPKLLRALEEREIRRLGPGSKPRSVDVRIIAATNRKLSEAAHKDEFRRDLFYRLAVARVTVPPLRDRNADISPLAQHFLRGATGTEAQLPDDLRALLDQYRWPGNVRELRNVIHRYAFMGLRRAEDLFDEGTPIPADGLGAADYSGREYRQARQIALERFEAQYVQQTLELAGGVVARAAEIAGVARPSFHRMMDRVKGRQSEGSDHG